MIEGKKSSRGWWSGLTVLDLWFIHRVRWVPDGSLCSFDPAIDYVHVTLLSEGNQISPRNFNLTTASARSDLVDVADDSGAKILSPSIGQ